MSKEIFRPEESLFWEVGDGEGKSAVAELGVPFTTEWGEKRKLPICCWTPHTHNSVQWMLLWETAYPPRSQQAVLRGRRASGGAPALKNVIVWEGLFWKLYLQGSESSNFHEN